MVEIYVLQSQKNNESSYSISSTFIAESSFHIFVFVTCLRTA